MYLVEEVNYLDWKEISNNCHQINMLQSWQYGDAKAETGRWNVVRFLITNEDGDSGNGNDTGDNAELPTITATSVTSITDS